MNKLKDSPKTWSLILVAALALTAIAWAGTGGARQRPKLAPLNDSVPPAKHIPAKKKKPRVDIDAEINVEPDLENLHIELNGLHEALESVDWDHIDREIEQSTQAILDSINIPEIDLSGIEVNIEGVDAEQIGNEVREAVQQAVRNIDLNDVNAEIHDSLDDLNIELDDESYREDARREKNIESREALLDQLEEDELISSGKDFTIEYKDRNLYINNEKQSPKTAERYRKYFRNGQTRLLYKNGRFISR